MEEHYFIVYTAIFHCELNVQSETRYHYVNFTNELICDLP